MQLPFDGFRISCPRQGFNPHPSRGTGATISRRLWRENDTSFNPHPSRGTGATSVRHQVLQRRAVSILTRPEGRVQPRYWALNRQRQKFQSSPVPRDGCNPWSLSISPRRRSFQSSPVPRDGCNGAGDRQIPQKRGFNPHPSRGTGATQVLGIESPEAKVSILTRPEGRVQRRRSPRWNVGCGFQSSPVPRDGCNTCAWD